MNTLIEGDCAGAPLDLNGHNIESPGNTCGFNQATDQPAQGQLNLGPLADNGGPTETHALLQNSVAIDQIPQDDCVDGAGEPLSEDQRGEPRPAGAELQAATWVRLKRSPDRTRAQQNAGSSSTVMLTGLAPIDTSFVGQTN